MPKSSNNAPRDPKSLSLLVLFTEDRGTVDELLAHLLGRVSRVPSGSNVEMARLNAVLEALGGNEDSGQTPDDKPKLGRAQRATAGVTGIFLNSVAEALSLPQGTVDRLLRLLDSEAVRDLAEKARPKPIDLRFGLNGGFQVDQLKRLDALPELNGIHGLGPNSQARKLLKAAIGPVEELFPQRRSSQRPRQTVAVKDEVTQMFLRTFGEQHGFDVRVVLRLWAKFESKKAQDLANANDVDLSMGPDNGYMLDAVRKFESLLREIDEDPNRKQIHGLGPASDTRKLLQRLAAHKG